MHYVRASAVSSVITMALIVFGIIYDEYGRGVHSRFMTYAFICVFALCVLPYSVLASLKSGVTRSRLAFNVYNSGVSLLSLAFVLRGVVRIAGTKSRFEVPMLAAGAAMCAAGALIFLVRTVKNIRSKSPAAE
ncbi:MAG: hypothetical protein IKN38_08810 [Clostridia bacterium]|nr:hypothetical protein [Clostridia bacterium]